MRQTDWDVDKVHELVEVEDVDRVLALKLSASWKCDLLGWQYTKDGVYTIKSAHWFAVHHNSNRQIQPPPGNVDLKHQVWRLKTAPKIKHFLLEVTFRSFSYGCDIKISAHQSTIYL